MADTSLEPLADELRKARSAKPCVLVIFGATGDLTKRKLVPSLMGLSKDGVLPSTFAVVGFARRPWTCLLYTSPSPRDLSTSRMPSSA